MHRRTFCAYGTPAPSNYTQNWVEAGANVGKPNHPLLDLDSLAATFDQDVDEAVRQSMYTTMASLSFPQEPHPASDCEHPDYPILGFMDDEWTRAYSASQAPSPASSGTLMNSPFPLSSHVELPQTGDALVSDPAILPSETSHGFGFAFQKEPWLAMPTVDPSPLLHQAPHADTSTFNLEQSWPGQQPPQHEVGAAAVVAPGLAVGTEVNADPLVLTAIDPMWFSFGSILFPEPEQVPIASHQAQWIPVDDEHKPVVEESSMESNSSMDESSEDVEAPKKKRKQSTEKRYSCEYPGCAAMSARSHNIKIHMDSVHRRLRNHRCDAPECPRAFSRKHDLLRHKISAHTNIGSPRNPNNAKAAKGAMAMNRAGLKKEAYEAA